MLRRTRRNHGGSHERQERHRPGSRHAKGVVEGVKGKVKEAAGALTGKDELKHEGEAQQAKADTQREVATKEAEAEKARAQAASTRPNSAATSTDPDSTTRDEMYIGLGTVVFILLIVLIIYFVRHA